MQFLTIAGAAFAFMLMLLLFHRPRRLYGAKERRLRQVSEGGRLPADELSLDFHERFIAPLFKGLRRRLNSLGRKSGKSAEADQKMARLLRMAGVYLSVPAFAVVRLSAALGLGMAAGIALRLLDIQLILQALLLLAALILGFLLPVYAMRARARGRQRSIREQLPDMMDILSVSIDAGLSFDLALKRALDKFAGALKEEMSVTSMEIQMGKPRRIALTELGERNDVSELRMLASAVVQSEQMGTPIKQVLKTQSAQLRTARKQAAQEKGMKASVKMLLPMVAFIFPVIFIILLGPTVLKVMDTFRK